MKNLNFENVNINKNNLLGIENEGFKIAMHGLTGTRLNICACSIGATQDALEETLEYTTRRTQFNKNLIQFQNTKLKLAESTATLHSLRCLTREAAKLWDNENELKSDYIAMTKSIVNKKCFEIVDTCMQLLGAYGTTNQSRTYHHFNNIRMHQLTGGSDEIMKLIVAKNITQNSKL